MTERNRRGSNNGGIVHFSDEVLKKMDEALNGLLEQCKGKCGLMIDRTGLILSSAGDFHPISEDNMGAVAAGVVAALNTMVSRASTPEVSVKFYGSDIDRIHFCLISDRFVLCMLHGKNTTTGQVRAAVKQFSSFIVPIIEKERASETQGEALIKSVQYIEDKLNDMFKDFS